MTNQTSKVIQHLRKAVLLQDMADLTDGQLLECFIEHREEAAFAALVKRHGPMVWGVCHRLLHHHDAEDAFQATFLVLFRKAASIKPRAMVGNWLYGVAHQTALHARRTASRRTAREKQVTEMPEATAAEQDLWNDLRPLLDQELSRLPAKYRAVIVLCDLEGKTRTEAARQLGCPEGTVAGRLARARTMMAKRLARYGLAMSGGTLAAVLSEKAVPACVPTSLLSSTIQTASLFAAGHAAATGAISAKVIVLTEGVLKTMLLTKLKIATIALLTVSLVGLSTTVMAYRTLASDQDQATNDAAASATAKKTDKPKAELTEKVNAESKTTAKSLTTAGTQEPSDQQPKARSDENEKRKQRLEGENNTKGRLHALLKERLEIVKRMADRLKREHERGVVGQEVVWQADLRVYRAELDLCETTKERIAIFEKIVNVYKKEEERLVRLVMQNQAPQDVLNEAKLKRLEAEIALEREKAKLGTPPK